MEVMSFLDPLAVLDSVVAYSVQQHTVIHTHSCPYSSKPVM